MEMGFNGLLIFSVYSVKIENSKIFDWGYIGECKY